MSNKEFYPSTTFICYLSFLVISIITNTIKGHIIILLFLFIFVLSLKINIYILIKKILKLKFLFIFLFLFNILFHVSFYDNIIMLLKMIEVFIYTNILINKINLKQFNYGINQLFAFLKKFNINPKVITFSLTLTIKFIPIIINQAKTIFKSIISKGVNLKSLNFCDKLLVLKSIIIPIIIRSTYISDKTAISLECNLYDLNEKNTNYKTYSFHFIDLIFIFCHLYLYYILLKGGLL